MSMNSFNVEKTKKILVPFLLTAGGLWASYVGLSSFPYFSGILKFQRYTPQTEMLEKAWERFDYDPQTKSVQQLAFVIIRTSMLYKEAIHNFSKVMKKLRVEYIEDLNEFVSLFKEEINLKITKSRMCFMQFITYKNHSFDQFYQKYFQEQVDQQIMQLIAEHDTQIIVSYSQFEQQLPTLKQLIEQLKIVIPLIKEQKPQVERICNMLATIGQERYQSLYLQTYLSDVVYSKHRFVLENILNALQFTKLDKINQPYLRHELQQLKGQFRTLWEVIVMQ